MTTTPLSTWTATCSCGGHGIIHLHADVHQPIATAEQPSLRDRIADAIRAATCPGECEGAAYCEHGRFQPTVWDDNGQPVEVGISGPPERIAALIANALAKETL